MLQTLAGSARLASRIPRAFPASRTLRGLSCTRLGWDFWRGILIQAAASSTPRVAFAFDIQGEHVLPQARRILSLLSNTDKTLARPIPYLMITNGGGVTEAKRREALSEDFGVDISPNQLVQSHTPLQDYVHEYADKPVLVVGGVGDAGRKVAESYGLKRAYILQDLVAWNPAIWDRHHLTDEERSFVRTDIDFGSTPLSAVFVIHDNGMDWGLATQTITEVLTSDGGLLGTRKERRAGTTDAEVPLVLTNPDIIWGSDYPIPRLGMGAFRIALEAVYKATTGANLPYTQFGKPYRTTYAFADSMLRRRLAEMGEDPEGLLNVYMVGDNPASDIAGANGYGWNSLLVKTGVYRDGTPAHVPTRIVENVEEGVLWALEKELGTH